MGGAVSTGDDNDDLVDNLVEADYIKSERIERIFRAVDRADYFLPEHRDSAYKDLAWKHGHLHLSAPCIYSEVLESLQLEEGMSFLNLGSGTGYLSTMAGLILGSYGINHGVEVHEDVVEYARAKLDEFKHKSSAFEEFDFAEPQFVIGNCLQLSSASRLYDRVYCGAACPPEHENYMRNLIKVDGILVMPLNDQLLQVRRISETEWTSKSVLPVSFATLVVPSKDKNDIIELPDFYLLTLQDICRHNIRSIIREKIFKQFPKLDSPIRKLRPPKPQTNQSAGRRSRLVNLIPMQMGMMYLNNLENNLNISNDEIDEEDETPHPHRHRHRLDDSFECSDSDCSFCGDLKQYQPSSEQVNHLDKVFKEQEEGELKFLSTNNNHHEKVSDEATVVGLHPERAGQEDFVCGISKQIPDNFCRPSTSSSSANTADNKRSSPDSQLSESEAEDSNNASKRMRCSDSEEDEEPERESIPRATEDSGDAMTQQKEGGQDPSFEEISAALTNSAPILISLRCGRHMHRRDRSSDDSDLEHMELDHGSAEAGSEASGDRGLQRPVNPTSVLDAFNLLSLPRKLRYSSSTSADTAYTSGFGSFGDESLDLPVLVDNSAVSESKDGDGNGSRGNKQTGPITKESIEEEDGALGGKAEGPTLGQLLKEYIQMLPLPLALRSYLAYYRK